MAIGTRIVEALKERGWTRNDLMERVPNLTPQALSNLIRRDSARSEWDQAIAEALGVSVLWLVYGVEPRPGDEVGPLTVHEPIAAYKPFTRAQAEKERAIKMAGMMLRNLSKQEQFTELAKLLEDLAKGDPYTLTKSEDLAASPAEVNSDDPEDPPLRRRKRRAVP